MFDRLALGRVEAAATVSRAERGAAKKREGAHDDPEAPTTELEAAPIAPRGRPEGTFCKPQTIRRGARRGTS